MTRGAMERAIKSIQRHDGLAQPFLSAFEMALFVIGAFFWAEARLSDQAFNARIYGDFALLFPAELWAGAMMGGAALTWVGLRHPVKRWMVVIGASIMAAQFMGLAYSSIVTGGEPIIGLFCSVLFAPAHVWMGWEAMRNGA